MKSISLADLVHLRQPAQTWAVCWQVTNKLGSVLRLTNHDAPITVARTINNIVLDGEYTPFSSIQSSMSKASTDLSVDNLDVDVLLSESGITAADIRAGIFDNVVCTIFIVNWSDTTDSGILIQHGRVGNFRSFVNGLATGEVRGLKQQLQQIIIDLFSLTCRVPLGSPACGVNLASYTFAGTVLSVTNRRVFTAELDGGSEPEPGFFRNGLLTMTSGASETFQQEIKLDQESAGVWTFTLFEPLARGLEIGDTFTVSAGCNKLHVKIDGIWQGDCKDKFDNLINFQGEPFIPGNTELLRGAQ